MRISTLAVAALAGLIAGAMGGAIGSHMTVYAQDSGIEILRSKNFVLLDRSGHKRGEWMMDPSGEPALRLFDSEGRLTWQAGKGAVQLLHQP
jgi:hypothetical protein